MASLSSKPQNKLQLSLDLSDSYITPSFSSPKIKTSSSFAPYPQGHKISPWDLEFSYHIFWLSDFRQISEFSGSQISYLWTEARGSNDPLVEL